MLISSKYFFQVNKMNNVEENIQAVLKSKFYQEVSEIGL